jgi:hypothetical protein
VRVGDGYGRWGVGVIWGGRQQAQCASIPKPQEAPSARRVSYMPCVACRYELLATTRDANANAVMHRDAVFVDADSWQQASGCQWAVYRLEYRVSRSSSRQGQGCVEA